MAISKALATVLLATFCASPVRGFVPPTHTHRSPSQGVYSATSEHPPSYATVDDADEATKSTSSESLTLFSPCKINLFLRIIRKRPDGFHDLASLFQAVGFGDTLRLSPTEGDADEFSCNMEGVPTDSTNLVLRALELMRRRTGRDDAFFEADLVKRVPAQAGLGGGSANAATAMWGANELMGRPATLDQVRAPRVPFIPNIDRRAASYRVFHFF